MRRAVDLPSLGDYTGEVLIVAWRKAVGDAIAAGDPLLLVETDKVQVEVEAPRAGVLVQQLVAEGDEIAVGTPVCVLDSPG